MSNPFDQTILLSVTIHQLGTNRKVNTDFVEVDAEKDLLRITKKLFECPEYKKITSISSELKAYLRKKSVPAQLLKSGIFPIPVVSLEQVDDKLLSFRERFNEAVDLFMDVYEARIEESMGRLRALGQRADYPRASDAKAAFEMRWEYCSLGPPNSLQEISRELFEREKRKAEATWREAAEDVKVAMRLMFRELTNHMIDRLTPNEDGTRKRFKEGMIKNFKEFLVEFPARNITNDDELASLVEKTKAVLNGANVLDLRESMGVRDQVRTQVETIQKELDGMLADGPIRSIRLEEEPEGELCGCAS